MTPNESLIIRAIQHYYPGWEAPDPSYKEWVKVLCPFHGENTPSAAVSYEREAFHCLACSVSGDAISIIRHEEGVSYQTAKQRAKELSVGGCVPVSGSAARKSSRRVSRWTRDYE